MNWITKISDSDEERIQNNIERLRSLQKKVHSLGLNASSYQQKSLKLLESLLADKLVKGRKNIFAKLNSALMGENNSKLVLDNPKRFQTIMVEVEDVISREITKETQNLRKLRNP